MCKPVLRRDRLNFGYDNLFQNPTICSRRLPCSLFNGSFQTVLWKDLRLVFPRCPKHQRKRQTISSALNLIRNLRNRVFHHEQFLWLAPSLLDLHMKGTEVIGWLDPQLVPWLAQYDRLPATWAISQGYSSG
ncbi:hypothetical protein ALP16_200019 [Pseudomonas savastanoi]|uniref:Abi-like protein n=1 Tax=Pseudomonas savastanoi TaxID=29438 RepID=A0A3M6AMZ7_PSESS|nr:hypothetical protein ALP16_200019 [Pseudomonas savastanoi]